MEGDSLRKKRNNTKNTIVWIGVCLILLAVALFFGFFLQGDTRIDNLTDEHIFSDSLSCGSEDVNYPYFIYDNSRKKEIKINVVFANDRLDTISLVYKLYYNSADDIKASETTNHAEMNKSFASHGLGADAFGANYSILSDAMQMALYAEGRQLNSILAKYFFLDEEPEHYQVPLGKTQKKHQKIILMPGESYESSFRISNPSSATEDAYYELSVEPFYLSNENEVQFEAHGDNSEIVKWISFQVPTDGVLEPNEVRSIKFEVEVPENVAAGGQYASIIVTLMSKGEQEGQENTESQGNTQTTIKEIKRIAHLLYAEVAGDTVKGGEIIEANVPSFLLSGDIKGSSLVKNTGNVHSDAKYTLQVFPLFSSEEIYTNEEKPENKTVLPDRTLYSETVWDETPNIGIFNVVYTVEFEGSKAEVRKMVIKCPLWLLFLVLFAVAAIIIYFVTRTRTRRGTRRDEE